MAEQIQFVCTVCQKPSIKYGRIASRKYCSRECKVKAAPGLQSAYPGVSNVTVGAIGELLVAADLLRRGYAVFRALSPGCSCDLAILRDGRLIRVEVKTGYRLQTGRIATPALRSEEFDILAICIGPEIVYRARDTEAHVCDDLLSDVV